METEIKYLTASEIAKKLGVANITVRKWLLAGLFTNARLEVTIAGKIWLVPESDLIGFVPPERGRPPKKKE
jgi:hypothetical protein